jgi:RHS repeat-associated protein
MRSLETGLDYFGARRYWAELGRFTSPDPENAGANPLVTGSWNMYSYWLNNPLLYVDPSGRCSVKKGGAFRRMMRGIRVSWGRDRRI